MKNIQRFAIIFEGRTGSSYIVSSLNSCKNVLCMPEILVNLGVVKQIQVMEELLNDFDIEKINPYASNDRYYPIPYHHKIHNDSIKAVGFKTKITDVLNVVWLLNFFEENNFKLIHLKRKNILKSVLSELNAVRLFGATKQWNAESENQIVGGQLEICIPDFCKKLIFREKIESLHSWFFSRFAGNKIDLYYEDLLASEVYFFKIIANFLELDFSVKGGKFFKNTPDNLKEAIKNYNELENALKGTKYQRYFYY